MNLAEVARRAGVDISTASRILNADTHHRIAQGTREQVQAVARQLGYRPNGLARALRIARSRSLGMVVPQLDNPVFAQMIAGAEAAARERDYSLVITHIAEGDGGASAYERLALVNRVDGLLVASFDEDARLAAAWRDAGVPTIVLNRRPAHVDHVIIDTREAAKQAVGHLVRLGHKVIAHVGGRQEGYNGRERLTGYRVALHQAGIRYKRELVEFAGYTASGGVKAMAAILKRAPKRPTAVFAATMLSAAGAMKAIRQAGLAVPSDISVIALNDGILAEVLEPSLTTVRLPLFEMGQVASAGLIDLIDGRIKRLSVNLPPVGLVERQSTGRPANL